MGTSVGSISQTVLELWYAKYGQQIKPLVEIMFKTGKRLRAELLMNAVERDFDSQRSGRKAISGRSGEETLEAEYQVAG